MMNRVEMNNEMLEQVNGGSRMLEAATTSECVFGDVCELTAVDSVAMDSRVVDFASATRADIRSAIPRAVI